MNRQLTLAILLAATGCSSNTSGGSETSETGWVDDTGCVETTCTTDTTDEGGSDSTDSTDSTDTGTPDLPDPTGDGDGDGDGDTSSTGDTSTTSGDGDGDGDSTTGDGDGDCSQSLDLVRRPWKKVVLVDGSNAMRETVSGQSREEISVMMASVSLGASQHERGVKSGSALSTCDVEPGLDYEWGASVQVLPNSGPNAIAPAYDEVVALASDEYELGIVVLVGSALDCGGMAGKISQARAQGIKTAVVGIDFEPDAAELEAYEEWTGFMSASSSNDSTVMIEANGKVDPCVFESFSGDLVDEVRADGQQIPQVMDCDGEGWVDLGNNRYEICQCNDYSTFHARGPC